MQNHCYPNGITCSFNTGGEEENLLVYRGDHSLSPWADLIAGQFGWGDVPLDDMRRYEYWCSNHFITCVSYMEGQIIYTKDLCDNGACDVNNTDNVVSPSSVTLSPYTIKITSPICIQHNRRDMPIAISKLSRHERLLLLGEATGSSVGIEPIPIVYSFGGSQTKFVKAFRKSNQSHGRRIYVPIFDVLILGSRSKRALSSFGDPIIKRQCRGYNYERPSIDIACGSCQTERFFCSLINDCPLDGAECPLGDNFVNCPDSESKHGDCRTDDQNNSVKRKYEEIMDMDEGEKKRRKCVDETLHNVTRSDNVPWLVNETFYLPTEIIDDQILNRFLVKSIISKVRNFLMPLDSRSSTMNYIDVKRRDEMMTVPPFEYNVSTHDEGSYFAAGFEPVFQKLVEERGNCQNLVIQDFDRLLYDLKTLSLVCKSWKVFSEKHFAWQLVFQGIHTLYNSARVNITLEYILSSRYSAELDGTIRDYIMYKSPKVHGLYDCQIFASFTFSLLSNLMFQMINRSTNPQKTYSVFKNAGVFRLLVLLICEDTKSKWRNNPPLDNDEFSSILNACLSCFSNVFIVIVFKSGLEDKEMMLLFDDTIRIIDKEKLINVINS